MTTDRALRQMQSNRRQMGTTRDALLQDLAGVMCARLSLGGKAQHLFRQSVAITTDLELKRDAQRALDAVVQRRD